MKELIIRQDTREQCPLPLDRIKGIVVMVGTMATGDYAIDGAEHLGVVERKELGDLIACVTSERLRFKRELARLAEFPAACVVIEANMDDVICRRYRSACEPESILGSCASWGIRYGVPFIWASHRYGAARAAVAFLRRLRAIADEGRLVPVSGNVRANLAIATQPEATTAPVPSLTRPRGPYHNPPSKPHGHSAGTFSSPQHEVTT